MSKCTVQSNCMIDWWAIDMLIDRSFWYLNVDMHQTKEGVKTLVFGRCGQTVAASCSHKWKIKVLQTTVNSLEHFFADLLLVTSQIAESLY